MSTPPEADESEPAGAVFRVRVDDDFFEPLRVTVPLGATVEWRGGGNRLHTVTFTSGPWDSGPLLSGHRFRVAFTVPGVYRYRCSEHPGIMEGEIVVEAASS